MKEPAGTRSQAGPARWSGGMCKNKKDFASRKMLLREAFFTSEDINMYEVVFHKIVTMISKKPCK